MKTQFTLKQLIYLLTILLLLTSSKIEAQTKNEKMENAKNYIVEVIRYNIPTDVQVGFEKAYWDAGSFLKQSPYCLNYEVIKGDEEPNHYIVRIHWTSKEDHLTGFRNSAEFNGFFALVRPYFNNIEEMKHYKLTSNFWSKQ